MRLTSPSVQRLLNASERTLVESASAASLKELTAARLRSKVERTRRLKDKYADLAKARGRAGRGKVQPRGAAARTDRETMAAKVEVFEAVLARFTTQLAKVEKQAARAAAKKAGTATRQPTSATKRTPARRARAVAKKPEAAAAPPSMTKGEARALVAKVRRRVARTTGDPAGALSEAVEPTTSATDTVDAANTSVAARSQDAQLATVEQHFAATHTVRAQGHAGARTQRMQGKRDR